MTRVTKPEGALLPAPARFVPLGLGRRFSEAEAAQIADGFRPEVVEDKWLVYSEDGWIYFHRSWTGALIYWLRLEASGDGATIEESYASRDPAQYSWTDDRYDRELLSFLIDSLLLKREAKFPVPRGIGGKGLPGLLQHHVAGTGCAEKEAGVGGKQRSWLARLFDKK